MNLQRKGTALVMPLNLKRPQALNAKASSLVTMILAFIFLSVSSISAAVDEILFVDSASNGPSLGTEADPYHTIQEAVNQAELRDTIIVLGGSEANPRLYPERVWFNASGGAEDVIVTASPRRSVLMYGFDTGGAGDRLTLESFQVTIPQDIYHEIDGRYAIHMNSDYITVRDNYIVEAPGWAIRSNNAGALPVGGHVVGNRIYRSGAGIVIFGHDWLVENNEVERNIWYPIAGGVDADYSRAFGSNITIRNNHFHGTLAEETGTSHVDGFQFFDHNGFTLDNFVFENNVVSECGQGVIITCRNLASDNMIIRGNVFEGNMGTGAYTTSTAILVRGFITNFVATHNLVSNVRYHGINTNEGMQARVQNNILYNAGTNYRASADATLVGGFNLINVPSNRSHIDPNDLVGVDPMFTDPGNWLGNDGRPWSSDEGFMLRPESPAINAGTDTTFTEDMFGTMRPHDGAFDIGPQEYLGEAPQCTPIDPNISISPATRSVSAAGTLVDYTITARDNDGASCEAATFTLTASVPAGWSSSWSTQTVTLEPGASASFSFSVASSADAEDGSYNLLFTLTDVDFNRSPQSVSASYIIEANAPEAISDLAAGQDETGAVHLSWSHAVHGSGFAASYSIMRNAGSGFEQIGTVADNSFVDADTTVSADTTYRYYVVAFDADNNASGPSNTATVQLFDSQAPEAISDLSGVLDANSAAHLAWSPAADGSGFATSYAVWRNAGAGFQQIATVGTNAYVDNNMVDSAYSYYVIAYDANGNASAPSNTLTMIMEDTEAPDEVTDLAGRVARNGSIPLTWSASADGAGFATGYAVYRNTGSGFAHLESVSGTSFRDRYATGSSFYEYYVIAIDADGNTSAPGNVVRFDGSATDPDPDPEPDPDPVPPGSVDLTGNEIRLGVVRLTWSDAPNAVSYSIMRDAGSGFQLLDTIGGTGYKDRDIAETSSTVYRYYIVANDASGNVSDPSNTVSVSIRANR